ncbi:alkylhydroperoxidase AhpD family core domain-containing protein [Rhizobiales bacterium GAS188]|nr:alkylhydroperoxidase AhpD family core domain-containing protein [Rhizobiales bacterium GAS188]
MSQSHARMEQAKFRQVAPPVGAALQALSQAAVEAGLEKELLELIKLRASQMNGCAFCVQYHLNEARRLGIPGEKLDLVIVWREAGVFSEREAAAFAWTETLTDLMAKGVPDEAYANATKHFSEKELAYLTAAVGTINVWNRIAVAYRYTPPVPRQAKTASAA